VAADGRPRAALLVAAALVALPLGRREPGASACPAPSELAARAGHTTEAACTGGLPLRGPARLLFGLRLDPNTADAASLEVLPGIGAARARAVVAARSAAPFTSLRDLERVPGIGPRTRAALEPWLEIAGHGGDAAGASTRELPGTPGTGEPPSTRARSSNVPSVAPLP